MSFWALFCSIHSDNFRSVAHFQVSVCFCTGSIQKSLSSLQCIITWQCRAPGTTSAEPHQYFWKGKRIRTAASGCLKAHWAWNKWMASSRTRKCAEFSKTPSSHLMLNWRTLAWMPSQCEEECLWNHTCRRLLQSLRSKTSQISFGHQRWKNWLMPYFIWTGDSLSRAIQPGWKSMRRTFLIHVVWGFVCGSELVAGDLHFNS